MIAMTTKSSIRVNPLRGILRGLFLCRDFIDKLVRHWLENARNLEKHQQNNVHRRQASYINERFFWSEEYRLLNWSVGVGRLTFYLFCLKFSGFRRH